MNILDNPLIHSILFYPRTATPNTSRLPNVTDGRLPVDDQIKLGYRLYTHQPNKPVMLYFHGNGEVASDYDYIFPMFQAMGVSLLVVDYRGYGWSTGEPKASALMSDVEAVKQALPDMLKPAGLDQAPLYIMGRSLGSISAIHMSKLFPELFKGLIVESGIGHSLTWLASKGLAMQLLSSMPDPIGNADKMKEINLPLLILHGEEDRLLPPLHGQALYDASPAKNKRIVRIPRAGHNDIMMVGERQYIEAVQTFIKATTEAPDSSQP